MPLAAINGISQAVLQSMDSCLVLPPMSMRHCWTWRSSAAIWLLVKLNVAVTRMLLSQEGLELNIEVYMVVSAGASAVLNKPNQGLLGRAISTSRA